MINPLHISLLGGVTFCVDDHPLPGFSAVKAQALLIYLAVTSRPHSRQTLAGLLWPDVLETSAQNSLRVTLNQLRQAAPDYVNADRQAIALASDHPIRLDVAQFVHACSRLQGATAAIDEREIQSLRAAVHLYRGDFLAGFHAPNAELFDEWVAAERAYYERLALDTLTRLAVLALERGAFANGIEDAQRALTLDPLHEEAHRLLMRLYAYNGQTPHALRQYEECVALLKEELGVPPDDETTALYEAIHTRTLLLPERDRESLSAPPPSRVVPTEQPARRPRHNVPHQTTPFVGRVAELAQLRELLAAPNQRLITIVAPGGMGKTRLSQEAALTHLESFADGVYFVALAGLGRADELVPAIADAVNYPMQAGSRTPHKQLLDFLLHKRLLLVLDNFEHLLDSTALITDILEAASAVKILATSRERLRLTSETVLSLGGLAAPDETGSEVAALSEEMPDAIRLFVHHARRVAPDFTLTAQNWPSVAKICRLTYGMPLGIVLAATWVSLLPVDEIASEIAQSLHFLEADLRDLPPRQRSLISIFDHTWQHLRPAEQDAFVCLSVFRSSFTRQAAYEVAAASTRLLLSLADKALIQRDASGRYQMHELLRQYGIQKLEQSGLANQAHTAHSRYFLHFLGTLEADLKGRRQLAALAEIEADVDNVRAAWSWALDSAEYAAVESGLEPLFLYYGLRFRRHEGAQTFWRAYQSIEGETATVLRDRVFVRYCLMASEHRVWTVDTTQELMRILAHVEARGDHAEIALCWYALGYLEWSMTNSGHRATFDDAIPLLNRSLESFRTLDDACYMARLSKLLGSSYGYDIASMDQFMAFHVAAVEHARRAGSVVDEADALANLGWGAIDMGQFADAERYCQSALALPGGEFLAHKVAIATIGLSFVQFANGRLDTAHNLARQALAITREINSGHEGPALALLGLIAAIAGDFPTALHYLAQTSQILGGRYFYSYTNWAIALAQCGLGDFDLAWNHLRASHYGVQVPSSIPRILAVAAVLLAPQGERARAAEVLGSVFNDRHSAHGWMEQWRPLTELRARLRTELGATRFQELWDRGAHLNAERLADQLLGPPPGREEAD